MYRALFDVQTSQAGQAGLLVGVGLGLLVLTGVYVLLRSASGRLPLKPFFQVSGLVLFAMAVVFAGQGVAALQVAGLIKVTPLSRLGEGLPALGLYPNVQVVSVQALLLGGAALALVLLLLEQDGKAPDRGSPRQTRDQTSEKDRDDIPAVRAPEDSSAHLVEVSRD
jgi:high-affinity iron transporter